MKGLRTTEGKLVGGLEPVSFTSMRHNLTRLTTVSYSQLIPTSVELHYFKPLKEFIDTVLKIIGDRVKQKIKCLVNTSPSFNQ